MNKNRTRSPTVKQPTIVLRSWHLTSSSRVVYSTAVYTGIYLAQHKFNARIFKINMVEGTDESFLARKLSELKFSNSSGPCACIHLLLVSIVRSFTLQHVYTRKGTSKRFVVVHYQVWKCIYKFLKFSYFLTGGKDLKSLAEDYFWRQTSRRGRRPTGRLRFWQQRWN